jgi:hypothetical protein
LDGRFAIARDFYHSEMAEEHDALKEQFCAAVIHAFEYTYELAYKMIRRQLAQIVANPAELKEMSFMDLIRTGKEAGLVREAPCLTEGNGSDGKSGS